MLCRELVKRLTYQVFLPGALSRERYEAFRELVTLSDVCLERIARLEEIAYGHTAADWSRVVFLVQELEGLGGKIVDALTGFSPSNGVVLLEYFRKIAFYLKLAVDTPPPDACTPFTRPLARGDADAASLGCKAARLAWAMHLPDLPVPPGFVVTAGAFQYFLEANNLRGRLDEQLRGLSLDDPKGLEEGSAAIRSLLGAARIPGAILEEIGKAGAALPLSGRNARLAVRSSVAADDGGRCESFLNIAPEGLAEAWRKVVMGKYSPGALTHRIRAGLSDTQTPMAVLVMPMVDAVHSGVFPTGQRPSGAAGLSGQAVERLARLALQLEKLFGAPQEVSWAVDRSGRPWILGTRPIAADDAPGGSLAVAVGKRLEKLLPHVAALNLVDPKAPDFRPEGCRSVYDVARYASETAMREMFRLADISGQSPVKELKSRLPLSLRVLDLGRGLFPAARGKTEIVPDDVTSTPFWALWMGFSQGQPQDDTGVLTGFAVIDESYAHLMLRLGGQFCAVDALCADGGEKNHVIVRVKGGGPYTERLFRAEFLRLALTDLGFHGEATGDLFEARLSGMDCNGLRQRLVALGRLIMAASSARDFAWTRR